MAVFYLVVCLLIILVNITEMPNVIMLIVTDAFTGQAVAGGAIGTAFMMGVKRGAFSNEAGMGSAAQAAAAATQKHPFSQGFIQAASVFIDTIILCSATAFVVILSGVYIGADINVAGSVGIVQDAFSYFLGDFGQIFLTISLVFFTYTTIIGLYYYLEVNLRFIFGNSKIALYALKIIVLACLFYFNTQAVSLV